MNNQFTSIQDGLYIILNGEKKIKEKQEAGFKNPKFSPQLPSSGGYFLQLNVGKKNCSHNDF